MSGSLERPSEPTNGSESLEPSSASKKGSIELRTVPVKVLREELRKWGLPKKASEGAAGLDLVACCEGSMTLKPGERAFIPTGMAIHLEDPRLCALILSRSGLGAKQGLTVAQGVGLIDSDYTGEIKVALLNTSDKVQWVEQGQRIAQLLVLSHVPIRLKAVSELAESERGEGGFGSTGTH
jgi:dUTP pyrophosphatase